MGAQSKLDASGVSGMRVGGGIDEAVARSRTTAVTLVPERSVKLRRGQLIGAIVATALISGAAVSQLKEKNFTEQLTAQAASSEADKALAVAKASSDNTVTVDKAVTTALANQQAQFDTRLRLEKEVSYNQGKLNGITTEAAHWVCPTKPYTNGERTVLGFVVSTKFNALPGCHRVP